MLMNSAPCAFVPMPPMTAWYGRTTEPLVVTDRCQRKWPSTADK